MGKSSYVKILLAGEKAHGKITPKSVKAAMTKANAEFLRRVPELRKTLKLGPACGLCKDTGKYNAVDFCSCSAGRAARSIKKVGDFLQSIAWDLDDVEKHCKSLVKEYESGNGYARYTHKQHLAFLKMLDNIEPKAKNLRSMVRSVALQPRLKPEVLAKRMLGK